MGLTATLTNAGAVLTSQGLALSYTVLLTDDQLGDLGTRSYQTTDPTILANVTGYIQQMMPSIEQQVGVPVSLPFTPGV